MSIICPTCLELKLQKPMALTSPRSTSLSMAAQVSSRDTPLNITWRQQVEEVHPGYDLSVWVLGHVALVLSSCEAAGPVD